MNTIKPNENTENMPKIDTIEKTDRLIKIVTPLFLTITGLVLLIGLTYFPPRQNEDEDVIEFAKYMITFLIGGGSASFGLSESKKK